ncbi:hypothetical protein BJX76DRAFT_291929 [Aspergillus varians]
MVVAAYSSLLRVNRWRIKYLNYTTVSVLGRKVIPFPPSSGLIGLSCRFALRLQPLQGRILRRQARPSPPSCLVILFPSVNFFAMTISSKKRVVKGADEGRLQPKCNFHLFTLQLEITNSLCLIEL